MRTRVPNEQNTAPPGIAKNELSEDVMEFIINSNGPGATATAGTSASSIVRQSGPGRATMILTANPNAEANIPFESYLPGAEQMAFSSPTLEDILGFGDSSDGPLMLNPGSKRGRRPMPSADEDVMSEASDAKRPRDRSETNDDDERVRQRKAQSARSSRQKHKEYVRRTEMENERLRNSHAELEELNAAYKNRIQELETQVNYLRRVIANDTAIARLVSALPGVEGVQLSSSMGASAPDLEGQFVPGGGVCLHIVDKNRVSLELCAECARRARAARTAAEQNDVS